MKRRFGQGLGLGGPGLRVKVVTVIPNSMCQIVNRIDCMYVCVYIYIYMYTYKYKI